MEHRSKLLTLLIGLSLVLQACNLQFVESTQKDPNAANLELTAIVQQMMIDQAAQQGNAAPATFTAEPGGGAPAPAIPAPPAPVPP
ncbi:MAG TPA: hypothetical protein PLE14_07255 [Anaerolineales bacterium]|nr:hypothetical protein [Anaerolineales bacterium]